MRALTFLLHLREPVLTTQVQSEEANSAVAYPFIPGGLLRGALISRYLDGRALRLSKEDPAWPLFFSGAVRFLNAYPAHSQTKERSLPQPLSWFTDKDDDAEPPTIFDYAHHVPAGMVAETPQGTFVWQTSNAVQLTTPAMVSFVHNTSDDPNRKSETLSQVYRYDALAPDQTFAGVVIADDNVSLPQIKQLLEQGDLQLGGSRTGGYGRVTVSDIKVRGGWQEFQPFPTPKIAENNEGEESDDDVSVEPPSYAILTCLSDVIWRNRYGQAGDLLLSPSGAAPERAYYRVRPVGGFNRKWGLPLCQEWAFMAGSVFVFPAAAYEELLLWVASGVGERRAEGFGRVALNWHNVPDLQQSKAPGAQPPTSRVVLSDASHQLAQLMAKRQLQRQVDRALIEEIQRLSNFSRLPKPVQLSRARAAARRAWLANDLGPIQKHFATLSPTAQKQWRDARISGDSFKEWIEKQIAKPKPLVSEDKLPTVAGVAADYAAIQTVTAARLIEGVLRKAVKKAKARVEEG